MLADVKSQVIKRFHVLNTEVPPGDIPAYGVPFPAIFVTDNDGNLVRSFVHNSYKIRSSPEHLIDSIRGEISIDPSAPSATAGDNNLRINVYFHGGRGTLRQGIERQIVVRIEPREGIQIIAGAGPHGPGTSVAVTGPPGLVIADAAAPATVDTIIAGENVAVFQGNTDLVIPVYAQAALISECRPIENDSITIRVEVRVVASDGAVLLEPKTEILDLEVFLEPVDMPRLRFHGDTGQRRSDMDSEPHLRRLVLRQFRRHPLGAIRSILNTRRMQGQAQQRTSREQ